MTSEIADMNYQGYKGFIVPGIAAMAIMQNGIFSVVFTLLSYKNQGVLKRLKAAPISPSHFIVGHLISRVSIIILQTFILLLMGVFVLGVSVGQGSILAWLNILFSTRHVHKNHFPKMRLTINYQLHQLAYQFYNQLYT